MLQYTEQRMEKLTEAYTSGLLQQTALDSFQDGHIYLSNTHSDPIRLPFISTDQLLTGNIRIQYDDSTYTDHTGIGNVKKRLEYANQNQIWNGEVLQVKAIDKNKITYQKSDYFTISSNKEKYMNQILERYLSDAVLKQSPRSVYDVTDGKINSYSGITHILSVDTDGRDDTVIFGTRTPGMNVHPSKDTTVPAGIVQPRHYEATVYDFITSHFDEEFQEELFNDELSQSEYDHMKEHIRSINCLGAGLNPLTYTLEYAVHVSISPELGRTILRDSTLNEELEQVYYQSIVSESEQRELLQSSSITPQTKFGLGLLFADTDNWSIHTIV